MHVCDEGASVNVCLCEEERCICEQMVCAESADVQGLCKTDHE